MKSPFRFMTQSVFFVGMLLMYHSAWAGGPVGHVDTLDSIVKDPVVHALEKEGYFYPPGLAERGSKSFLIKAFLWDHRKNIPNNNEMSEEREVDTLICLLIKDGYKEDFRHVNRGGKLETLCE